MRKRFPNKVRVAVLTLAALLLPAVIEAVYVSPTAIFIDDRVKSAQVTIGNNGDKAEEATIELKFGFPDADSSGTPYIRFVDDPGTAFPSAADWIRAFPQRVRLEPGTQQVVRLLAHPPDGLPDGEYWTRMIVTGRGAALRINGADTVLRAGVSLEIRLVTSVTYRKGHLTTGITIRDITAETEGDSLTVWARMIRTGNAAWLGTADVEMVNGRGAVVHKWSTPIAVHYPLRRRFAFPITDVGQGDYKIRFRLRSQRTDLPAEVVLPAATVMDSITVRVI